MKSFELFCEMIGVMFVVFMIFFLLLVLFCVVLDYLDGKHMDIRKETDRYPYTYAADLIRGIPDRDGIGCKLSRSEASKILKLFAKVIGMEDEKLAQKLADYYLANKETIDKGQEQAVIQAIKEGIYD